LNSSLNPHETKSLFTSDKRLLFILICLATFLLLYVKQTFVESETAAFEFLQDRPEGTLLRIILTLRFFAVPFIYLWKFTVIGFVVWVGCFMFGFRVTYGACWRIVLASEFIFLVPEVLKLIWFIFFVGDPNFLEVRAFYPLSLMQFFDYATLNPRFAYPLRALNAFEVFYWFMLVRGIKPYTRNNSKTAWTVVCCSYVLIFLLWLVFYIIVYK
jgi:hypothetical protein